MTIQYKGFSLVEDPVDNFEIKDRTGKVVAHSLSRGEGYLVLVGLADSGENEDVLEK